MQAGRLKRRRFGSLFFTVLVVETLLLILAGLSLPLVTKTILQHSTARIEDATLLAQAEAIGSSLRNGRRLADGPDLRRELAATFDTGFDGRAYLIVDGDRRVAARSRFAIDAAHLAPPLATTSRSFRRSQIIGVSMPAVTAAGQHYWVIVTQDQAQPGAVTDDVEREFLKHYLTTIIPLLALVPLVNALLLGAMLRKIRKVAADAAAIGPRSLNTRLTERGLPTEVMMLTHATNQLLARIEEAFHAQEEFAGNVAHELRTPLATLRIELAGLADDELRNRLIRKVEQMNRVIGQLSDMATLESAAQAPRYPVSLLDVAVEVVADLAPLALESGHVIAVAEKGGDARILADRLLIGLALSNLIRNAVQHTPPGTQIEVATCADGTIAVTDDGPGVAEQAEALLTRRFWRADQLRSDGAGLGLSIVARIAAAFDGRLDVANAPGGGAVFTLSFPLSTGNSQT